MAHDLARQAARITFCGHPRQLAPCPRELWASPGVLVQAGLHQLWRAGGANCPHAPGTGGAQALDLGAALFACAQLLHAAARPRGAATGHLHRLADAQNPRRYGRRPAVCAAVFVPHDRAVLGVHPPRPVAAGGGFVLRHQARGHGHRAACGAPHGLTGASKRLAVGRSGRLFCGHLCAECAVSVHCAGSRCAGSRGLSHDAWPVQSGWWPWPGGRRLGASLD